MIDIYNPATEEKIYSYTPTDPREIPEKIKTMRTTSNSWKTTSLESRIKVIRKFSNLLAENLEECSITLSKETGKPISQAEGEIHATRERINFFIQKSPEIAAAETVISTPSITEQITYDPLGIVANISAWNFPYFVSTNVLIPALLMGNQVVFKPSEFSTLSGMKLTDLLTKAGVPETTLLMISGTGVQGNAIVESDIDGIFFTGSYPTGKKILQSSREKLIPIQMELGGKDPLYLTDDSDLAQAVPQIADGIFYNNGQSCCSVERLYVHSEIFDRFTEELVNYTKKLKIGNPLDRDTYFGPLTRSEGISLLENQIDEATKKGAKILLGGEKIKGKGNYFSPTILAQTDSSMKIMQEESFGPIIGIQKIESDDQAISEMNNSHYGLTASVFCRDQVRAHNILRNLESGTAYWNCSDRVSPHLPWSGRKDSGMGNTLGLQGIRCFTRPRSWHLKTLQS